MAYLLLGLLIGIAVGWLAIRQRPHREKFLSTNEYWVYIPGDRMPAQDALMTRVLTENPYKQRGRNPVSPREGLLLSDIRLHLGLVLRSKNPHAFRPDLFEEHVEPTADILGRLSDSQALVKVRYISEQPLQDRASVQFLPHLADAVADLGGGTVIYDCVKEQLYSREDFSEMLQSHLDLDNGEIQVRQIWRLGDQGGWAETRGLRKIGLPELVTDRMEADEQVLVLDVLGEAANELWRQSALPEQIHVNAFGDEFSVVVSPPRQRESSVRIMRIQSL